MIDFKSKNTIKALSALPLLMGLSIAQIGSATEHETACMDHIQNKIAWDYSSASANVKKWEAENLENLCRGTSSPTEPGECFQKVMTGHLKWGASDEWEWKNALRLCAGTNNSQERIDCFKSRIASGSKWEPAILECQSSGKIVIR